MAAWPFAAPRQQATPRNGCSPLLPLAEAGRLMARHFVRLPTMATITALPREHASMGALIGVLARAEEFSNIMLRRCVCVCTCLQQHC